jgi:hypothetical protein
MHIIQSDEAQYRRFNSMRKEEQSMEQNNVTPDENLYEIWEDVVDFKQLLLSLLINTIGALGGYIMAPNVKPYPLLYGLAGAAIAFLVTAFLFKPKRTMIRK